ncbi:hypothetical protein [Actinoplanes philippinensis]|uniref:hypothetical protein n=1 Tax=Actinoplanes philippinensis TaxID=35752 RepID=UPI0033CB275F
MPTDQPQRRGGKLAESLGCVGALFLLPPVGIAVYFVVFPVLLAVFSDAYVTLACSATGGNPRGMAAAGWLLFITTAAGVLALTLIRGRVSRGWLYGVRAVVAVLAFPAWYLLPLRGSGLVETVGGPGGSGFITGARWGAPAAGLLLIIAIHVSTRQRARDFYVRHSMLRWTIGATSALAVAALVTAMLRAA